jgi:hypothetical protein
MEEPNSESKKRSRMDDLPPQRGDEYLEASPTKRNLRNLPDSRPAEEDPTFTPKHNNAAEEETRERDIRPQAKETSDIGNFSEDIEQGNRRSNKPSWLSLAGNTMELQTLETMLLYASLLRKVVPDSFKQYYKAASNAYLNTGENANHTSYADFGELVTNEITQNVNKVNRTNPAEGVKYGMFAHMEGRPDAYEELPDIDSNNVNIVQVEAPGGVERLIYMEEYGNVLTDVGTSEEDPDSSTSRERVDGRYRMCSKATKQ